MQPVCDKANRVQWDQLRMKCRECCSFSLGAEYARTGVLCKLYCCSPSTWRSQFKHEPDHITPPALRSTDIQQHSGLLNRRVHVRFHLIRTEAKSKHGVGELLLSTRHAYRSYEYSHNDSSQEYSTSSSFPTRDIWKVIWCTRKSFQIGSSDLRGTVTCSPCACPGGSLLRRKYHGVT